MLRLKPFRDKAAGLADLLNWSHLVDSGIVLCKDGSLLPGWFYRAPDIASSTDGERLRYRGYYPARSRPFRTE